MRIHNTEGNTADSKFYLTFSLFWATGSGSSISTSISVWKSKPDKENKQKNYKTLNRKNMYEKRSAGQSKKNVVSQFVSVLTL